MTEDRKKPTPEEVLLASSEDGVVVQTEVGPCGFCGTMSTMFVNRHGKTKCVACNEKEKTDAATV